MKNFIIITIILITAGMISNAHALSLTYGGDYYLGYYSPGEPASAVAEVSYINYLNDLAIGAHVGVPYSPPSGSTRIFDRNNSLLLGFFPDAVSTGGVKDDSGGITFDATNFEYILGKYDGPNGGSLVWYKAGGFGESVTLPDVWGPSSKNYDLSHISAYNPNEVPEPATILLFGTGLVGIAGLRRKIKKN